MKLLVSSGILKQLTTNTDQCSCCWMAIMLSLVGFQFLTKPCLSRDSPFKANLSLYIEFFFFYVGVMKGGTKCVSTAGSSIILKISGHFSLSWNPKHSVQLGQNRCGRKATGEPWQDSQDRGTVTGQSEQGNRDMTVRQGNRDRTVRTGEPWHYSQERGTVTGQSGQGNRDRTVRTGELWLSSQDKYDRLDITAVVGQQCQG